jgi:hypothetical protein
MHTAIPEAYQDLPAEEAAVAGGRVHAQMDDYSAFGLTLWAAAAMAAALNADGSPR